MKWTAILLGVSVLMTLTTSVLAEPVRSNGGACDSTGTARKDGKDQNGNKMNCQWDTCTYSECSTSGGSVGNCVKKTEYSNPTDCHPAALISHGNSSVFQNGNLGVQQFQPGPPRHLPPRVTGGGVVSNPGLTIHKPPVVTGLKGRQLSGGSSGSGVIQ